MKRIIAVGILTLTGYCGLCQQPSAIWKKNYRTVKNGEDIETRNQLRHVGRQRHGFWALTEAHERRRTPFRGLRVFRIFRVLRSERASNMARHFKDSFTYLLFP